MTPALEDIGEVIIEEIYDALKEAGASEEKARAAARAMAAYEGRIGEIKGEFADVRKDFAFVKWMLGFNLALSVATLFRVIS